MLTKEFYDEIAEEPMDYHRLIAKALLTRLATTASDYY